MALMTPFLRNEPWIILYPSRPLSSTTGFPSLQLHPLQTNKGRSAFVDDFNSASRSGFMIFSNNTVQ